MEMNLRDIREAKGFTQMNVAAQLGVQQSSVSNWENGLFEPNIAIMHQLAKLYGVAEGDIMNAITAAKACKA